MTLSRKVERSILLVVILVFAFVLIRSAWISDDSYITFRSIENFVHGYGPNYNIGQRVQTFTHPLWMFTLSGIYYFFLQIFDITFSLQIYYIAVYFSLLISVWLMFWIAFRVGSSFWPLLVGLGVLLLSRAFIDYSTSGLENPLTHLITVLALWLVFRERPSQTEDPTAWRSDTLWLSVLVGLAIFNRLDTGLLFAPLLVFRIAVTSPEGRLKTACIIVVGLSTAIAWELFSLLYYGFPFPNTAYAKLNTGVSQAALFLQGGYYFLESLTNDPITLSAIVCVVVLALLHRLPRSWPGWAVMAGVVLYFLYILKIGGDFMSGRFFSAPLLMSVIVLMNIPIRRKAAWQGLGAAVLFLGIVLTPFPTILNDVDYRISGPDYVVFDEMMSLVDPHGIADERAVYYRVTGLLRVTPYFLPIIGSRWEGSNWTLVDQSREVTAVSAAGFAGYRLGPASEVMDLFGLLDPLLARLPPEVDEDWRIGHFRRRLPPGYFLTRVRGQNLIQNKDLAEYYDALQLIVEGEIFSPERLKAIWDINLGRYDPLLESYIREKNLSTD